MTDTPIICRCCGNEARWCADGPAGCGTEGCDHIQCDHCGMHYSLENEASPRAETFEQMREAMLAAYQGECGKRRPRLLAALDSIEEQAICLEREARRCAHQGPLEHASALQAQARGMRRAAAAIQEVVSVSRVGGEMRP